MSNPIVIQLNEEATRAVLEQMLPKLVELLQTHRKKDPALTVKQAAGELGLSDDAVRRMVERGAIPKLPGITEIRIRQSVVDALGTSTPATKRK